MQGCVQHPCNSVRSAIDETRRAELPRLDLHAFVSFTGEEDFAPAVAVAVEHIQDETEVASWMPCRKSGHPQPRRGLEFLLDDLERPVVVTIPSHTAAANPSVVSDEPSRADEQGPDGTWREAIGLNVV